jgi:hypothetical protein
MFPDADSADLRTLDSSQLHAVLNNSRSSLSGDASGLVSAAVIDTNDLLTISLATLNNLPMEFISLFAGIRTDIIVI